MIFLIFILAFIFAYAVLDMTIPSDVRFHRVGGLIHWRCGRLGGSFYFTKAG